MHATHTLGKVDAQSCDRGELRGAISPCELFAGHCSPPLLPGKYMTVVIPPRSTLALPVHASEGLA